MLIDLNSLLSYHSASHPSWLMNVRDKSPKVLFSASFGILFLLSLEARSTDSYFLFSHCLKLRFSSALRFCSWNFFLISSRSSFFYIFTWIFSSLLLRLAQSLNTLAAAIHFYIFCLFSYFFCFRSFFFSTSLTHV